ncbi:MAG TPA: tetratricopeptide repeat protein [Thermohalobaculum sp.]|nr:tetratricopeptide repeat protein [Thermohalobaculum sp.]
MPAEQSAAEATLRAGVLPDAVPAIPAGAELEVAKEHFRVGNFGYSARYYEEAIALGRGSGEAWLGLAAAYDRLRRFDLADKAYAEAARRAGTTAAYHNNVGYSYLLRGDAAKAQRSFLRALELAPDSITIQNNLELLRDASHAGAA